METFDPVSLPWKKLGYRGNDTGVVINHNYRFGITHITALRCIYAPGARLICYKISFLVNGSAKGTGSRNWPDGFYADINTVGRKAGGIEFFHLVYFQCNNRGVYLDPA